MSIIQLPQTLPYQPLRMSVDKYHALLRAGAFTEHDAVELLDGVVIEKMSKNPPHRIATRQLDLALSKLVPAGWHVQNQEPITLETSEPEPDVAVVRGALTDYGQRHPSAVEVALVVEVADTTLVTDRYKAQLYARAGIPVFWLVNLAEACIEVHFALHQPLSGGPAYSQQTIYTRSSVVPVFIEGTRIGELPVDALLP
jgi:Uma2 family endonuclease